MRFSNPQSGASAAKVLGILFLVVVGVVALFAIFGGNPDTSSAKESPKSQPANALSTPAPAIAATSAASANVPAPSSTAGDDIKNLDDAIQSNMGSMGDTQEDFSDGAKGLALWAQDRIEWKDLAAIEATKPGLAMKDSNDLLGKRICSSGQIIEIAAADDVPGNVYVGELSSPDSDYIFRFIAIGSTGDLVQDNNAKFCGIFTGKVDYTNSMGGVAHAIQLVGMFDLPENHKPPGAD